MVSFGEAGGTHGGLFSNLPQICYIKLVNAAELQSALKNWAPPDWMMTPEPRPIRTTVTTWIIAGFLGCLLAFTFFFTASGYHKIRLLNKFKEEGTPVKANVLGTKRSFMPNVSKKV